MPTIDELLGFAAPSFPDFYSVEKLLLKPGWLYTWEGPQYRKTLAPVLTRMVLRSPVKALTGTETMRNRWDEIAGGGEVMRDRQMGF